VKLVVGTEVQAAADGVLSGPEPLGSRFAEDDEVFRVAGLRLKATAQ
jgi:hypothetical protein